VTTLARVLLLLIPVGALGLLASGCGGASPLLHPVHTLPQNQISVGGGVTSRVAIASAHRRISEAQSLASSNDIENGDVEQRYITGNLLERSLEPGLTPWVGGRVGLGESWEAGVAYTGHRLRVDGRHAFENATEALSLGSALHLLLLQLEGSEGNSPGDGLDQRLAQESLYFSGTGGGIEVPILFGTRRWSRWFEPSIGMRFGYEAFFGRMVLIQQLNKVPPPDPGTNIPDPGEPRYANALAHRFYAEGLIGLSAGSAPVFLRLEVTAGVHRAFGSVDFPEEDQFSQPIGNPKRRDFRLWADSIQPSAALVFEL
jgi:hypothetical protein